MTPRASYAVRCGAVHSQVLIHFKREFAFDEVLRLWEVFWSCATTRHLHLYLAVAVLVTYRCGGALCPRHVQAALHG